MIEIRNIKMFDGERAIREGRFDRLHVKDDVKACSTLSYKDDDGHYRVNISLEYTQNRAALFDTFEKAEKFYDALKTLLPDSDAQNAVIDHKDFE